MTLTDVTLDKDVISSDGETVGTVDRIIIHPDTLQIDGFVVHEGILFSHDRIVDEEFVDHIDADGNIVLRITAEQEDRLPELASRRVIEPDRTMLNRISQMEHMALPSAHGQVLVFSEPVDSRYAPAPDSPMQPAPTNPPPITDETNLPPNTVTIEKGMDVVDVSGEKVGSVDEVFYDDDDQLQAFVIEKGFIFKDHLRIPAAWIESLGDDEIRLTRTAQEAETAGKVD